MEMETLTITIENSPLLTFFLFVFAVSLSGIFITQLTITLVNLFNHKKLAKYYDKKAKEQDSKIVNVEIGIEKREKLYRKLDSLLIENRRILEENKKMYLEIIKANKNDN